MATEDRNEFAPRPLRPIPRASEKARDAFATAVRDKGIPWSPDQIHAVSRVLVDPKMASHALRFPLEKRIPTGRVRFIRVEVFTPAISVSPVNPRENETRVYAVGVRGGRTLPRHLEADSGKKDRSASLVVRGDSRLHVAEILKRSVEFLRREQPELREKIAMDGILDPIMLVVADFEHEDGTSPVAGAIAIDGSSRLAVASELTRFDPVDSVYRWPQDQRAFHSLVGQIVRIQSVGKSEPDEKLEKAHRVLTCQADIIIEAVSLDGQTPLPMLEACRALMSNRHVEKPLDWPDGGQRDQLADAVLTELREAGLDPSMAAYLAGTLPLSSFPTTYSPHLDVRAHHIRKIIFSSTNHKAVLTGIRTVVSRPRLKKDDKSEIATELMLRALRVGLDAATKLHARRASMARTLMDEELWPSGDAVGSRAPEALRAAALAELKSGNITLGEDRKELGFLGGYWLVSLDALRRDNRQEILSKDGKTVETIDARSGAQVVKQMLTTEEGIHQLYQAIVDGRAGRDHVQAVNMSGQLSLDKTGALVEVKDEQLRNRFRPQVISKDNLPIRKMVTPADQLAAAAEGMLVAARDLRDRRDRAKTIVDADRVPLVLNEGLDAFMADKIEDILREVAKDVATWGGLFKVAEEKRRLLRNLARDDSGASEAATVLPEIDLIEGASNDA
ncbi:hypothetical protein [Corallococcus caeni]|uniref:Uncharacterized protein n=1 Tax=Corallococcus caeni TaxID=3082388 RepID=A0ABQ6R0S4_9BACT|nr:hypothetical protein ASNO1_53260 [Corallococcus sp. NO1]